MLKTGKKSRGVAGTGEEAAGTAEPRPTRLQTIIALLSRPGGASIPELVAATGWQGHSVRGALAGSLKKKGHAVTSQKVGGVRRYALASGQ